MPTPESKLGSYNVLVVIVLREDTLIGGEEICFALRWSLKKFGSCSVSGASNASRHDGIYSGSVGSLSLSQDMGKTNEPNLLFPSITIRLERDRPNQSGITDDVIETIRDYDMLTGKEIEIYRVDADSTLPTSATQEFSGYVDKNGTTINENEVVIRATTRMKYDDKDILRETFGDDDNNFRFISEDWKNKKVPILIGDWDDIEDYWIEAPVIQTSSTDRNLKCRLCVPGESAIAQISSPLCCKWVDSELNPKCNYTGELDIINGSVATGIFEIDGSSHDDFKTTLDAADLIVEATELNSSLWTWQDGDKILVKNPKGCNGTIDYLPAGLMFIKNPVDIIYYLLTSEDIGLGISTDYIDTNSFEVVRNELLGFDFRARAFIAEQKTVLEIINQICYEFMYKLVIINGEYTLLYAAWNDLLKSRTIYEYQILDWKDGADTQNEGFSAIELDYQNNPSKDKKRRTFVYSPEDVSATKKHKVESEWIYLEDNATAISALKLMARGGILRTLELDMDFTGLDYDVGDKIWIETPAELSNTYQAIGITKNYDTATAKLTLIARNNANIAAVWCDEPGEAVPNEYGGGTVPTNWTAATTENKARLSYWVADGEVYYPDNETLAKVWKGD